MILPLTAGNPRSHRPNVPPVGPRLDKRAEDSFAARRASAPPSVGRA